jgi:hypothetical protein
MSAIWASAALICGASLVAGRALLVALGRREWTWLSGPVGLAVLVILAQPLIRLPGRGLTAAIVLGVLTAVSLVYLRGRWGGPVTLRAVVRDGLPVAIVVVAAASLPFLFSERTGVLGEGIYTNDQAAQLYWAQWLRDGFGPEPAGVALGYPLGPQSLVAALSEATGISLEDAFNGLLVAIPALTALAALGGLGELARGRRVVAAALVALPYLGASFLAQSGFKETAMALFLLGFALGLRELRRSAAILVPLGILAVASVFVFSLPGLLWPGAAAVAWLAAELMTGRLSLPRGWAAASRRRALPIVGAVVAILAVLALLLAGSLTDFLDRIGDVRRTGGRLVSPVSPREVLGVWPEGDFRVDVAGDPEAWAATLVGLVAVGYGAWWWVRRRDLAVPAALAGAAVIYLLTRWKGGIHVEAKALAIASPLVMLLALRALLDPRPGGGARRWAVPLLGALFACAAAVSTLVALRAAPVGTTDRAEELAELLPVVEGDRVLYLVPDRFASARLEGALVGGPGGYVPSQDIPSRRAKRWDQGRPLDFDTVPSRRMDSFRFAITTTAPFASFPFKEWVPTHATTSYVLWRRFGPTPDHGVLDDEDGESGAVLDCGDPADRRLSRREGIAAVIPEPVVRGPEAWEPGDSFETGEAASMELRLPPGRWELSIQYHSPVGVELSVPGLAEELPASLDGMFAFAPGEGPLWPAGTIDARGRGAVRIEVRQQEQSALQRLLGVERTTWLGTLVATRPGEPREVPLRDACGRYVDWFRAER